MTPALGSGGIDPASIPQHVVDKAWWCFGADRDMAHAIAAALDALMDDEVVDLTGLTEFPTYADVLKAALGR